MDESADADSGNVSAGKGSLIVVVGPSGSGKDSLLAAVKDHYADCSSIEVVQRVITRPADAGNEPHRYLSSDDFIAARDKGEFAVTWQAHDLYYGVPISILDWVVDGNIAILNGSRAALDNTRQVFPDSRTVLVSVDKATLASRLARRARESFSDISSRLNRQSDIQLRAGLDIEIDNSGELRLAVKQLLHFIDSVR